MIKKLHGEMGNAHMVSTFHVRPYRLAHKLKRWMSIEQLLHEDAQFRASKRCSRANVNGSSEGQVVLRIAIWLKLVSMLKLVGIAIARGIEEGNLISLPHLELTQRRLTSNRAGKKMRRIIVAKALLDDRGNLLWVPAQPHLLLGPLSKLQQKVACRVHRRLMACDHKASENRKQFLVGQEATFNRQRDELMRKGRLQRKYAL